jgi:hypothetical protein
VCISDKLTWIKVIARPEISPRVGHVMFLKEDTSKEEEILVFGGGDNAGSFFSDLLKIQIVPE